MTEKPRKKSQSVTSFEHFFVSCPRGLEGMLQAELCELGVQEMQTVRGGVSFCAPYFHCYKVNLESRIASRVLWRVGHSLYRNEQDIYNSAFRLPWPDWFTPTRTIRVNISAIKSPLKSLDFATLRVKDAICDKFRAMTNRRPSVDTNYPDVRIHVFLTAKDATFYLDTSGDPLFKRGYRISSSEAPLRENLAAGILRLTGWSPTTPLLDPMCGSGTFLAEAAMIAANMAPGVNRSFGFEKLKAYHRDTWHEIRAKIIDRQKKKLTAKIFGSDADVAALEKTRKNLSQIGMDEFVNLTRVDVLDRQAPANSGIMITNPPYGIRMELQEQLANFYPLLGNVLKKNYSGWTSYILSADMSLPKLIRLSASKRTPLLNGNLDCRLFQYRMVAGSARKDLRNSE